MKAAVLTAFGAPLSIQTLPAPVAGPGEIVVDVKAAPILPYTKEILAGARVYSLTPPMVPGCGAVACVSAVGPDATTLRPGDWVFCDPTLRSRDDPHTRDAALQGWDARGETGAILQQRYRDGPLAQQMRLPLENALPIPIDRSSTAQDDDALLQWSALNTLLVPYGGLASIGFSPGETLLVSGATGHFGSATVAVALAMGAARVVVAGRNTKRLAALVDRFGSRVVPVALSGIEPDDKRRMCAAGRDAIDCVLDFLPPTATSRTARAAMMSVRQGGRVVLMGGIGLQGEEDLVLPYPWFMLNNITVRGQWMYSRASAPRLVALVEAGLLRLDDFAIMRFALDDVNAAIEDAAAHPVPFRLTVVCP